LGGFTMILGGVLAIFEGDVKKLIAYSTLSQMGFLMFMAGFLAFEAVAFHIVAHAFFKSMLFVCVGYVILSLFHGQSVGYSGIFSSFLNRFVVVWSGFSIVGLMFISGFYSKHFFLSVGFSGFVGVFCLFFLSLGLVLTSVYTFRLFQLLAKVPFVRMVVGGQFTFMPAVVLSIFMGKLIVNSGCCMPSSFTCVSFVLGLGFLVVFLSDVLRTRSVKLLYVDSFVGL
jgi:NADH:ubiquinone oxidoreductase subunit 5 (subunit L)/multisubunit Na+/H+ antiporter MnhA subunit